MCGGTRFDKDGDDLIDGLSPRVRGNHRIEVAAALHDRSIPACAGEPCRCMPRSLLVGVYPRVCGGTWPMWSLYPPQYGLSPRVRGNHFLQALCVSHCGSIPACAGEPHCPYTSVCPLGVYPRVCGGTNVSLSARTNGKGLSPRVRGNHSLTDGDTYWYRSIPACAGEPLPRVFLDLPMWVYPRVCGGTAMTWRWRSSGRGLSPRVRGNRSKCSGRQGNLGSIPACAGEPPAPFPNVSGNGKSRSIPACAGEPCRCARCG